MKRRPRLRGWLLVVTGCGLLLTAVLWHPLHRGLIVLGVVALALGVSSFLQRYMQPLAPPSAPHYWP